MTSNLKKLHEEFPRSAISWRAQTLTKKGDKAMALAYIDARDVMRRLDDVCGPENWQDRFEFHGARTVCYLSIRVGDEWITKADAAGDTQVEAEKGGVSDSLKRAAVKWGIGRYLYDIPAPWVPCETYESHGKKKWARWTADPWTFVRKSASDEPAAPPKETQDLYERMMTDVNNCKTPEEVNSLMHSDDMKSDLEALPEEMSGHIVGDARDLFAALKAAKNLNA